MQKGKIIEQGNHDSLLKNFPDGLYAKFVKEQENSEASPHSKLTPIHEEEEDDEDKPIRANSTI